MITGSEAESRALMMNAAIRIVAKHGFEGFTTKKWALEAGVAEGSLYYHFKSKNDLLDETFLMIDHEIEELYLEEDEMPENPELLIAFFEELWRRFYHYLLDHPDRTLYYYRYRISPRYTMEMQKQLMEKWGNTLKLFQQVPETIDLSDNITSRVLWSFLVDTTAAFASRIIIWGDTNTAKIEREAARFIMKGLSGLVEKDGA